MYRMTRSLIEGRFFDVPYEPNTRGGIFSKNGKYFTPFGMGQPLMAIPFYVAGYFLKYLLKSEYAHTLAISFFNSFTAAFLGAGILFFFLSTKLSVSDSLLISTIASLSTMIYPYSKYFYSEPLFTLFLFLGFICLYLWQPERNYFAQVAGALLGMAILVKPAGLVLILAYLVYLFLKCRRVFQHIPLFPLFLKFSLPLSLFILVNLWFNWYRFGSIFETGYLYLPDGTDRGFTGSLLNGIAIFFFSPGKSFFLYNPILIISLILWQKFHRKNPLESFFIIIFSLSLILMYAKWCSPEGGATWGPRFLLPLIPFWCLILREIQYFSEVVKKRLIRLLIILGIIGLCLQLLGILVNYSEFLTKNQTFYYNEKNGRYNFWFTPWNGHLNMIIEKSFPLKKLFTIRAQSEVALNKQMEVINYPLWSDRLDLWFLHLIGDGYSAKGIFICIIILLLIFSWALFLIFKMIKKKNFYYG